MIIPQSRLRKGSFCIFWKIWRLAQSDGFRFVKEGWMLVRGTPKNAFFEFFLREVSTTPPPALPIYPAGGDPSPSAPGRPTHHRQQLRPCPNARQTTPRTDTHARMLDTLHRLHSIPDRPCRDDRTGCGALDCLRNVSDRARPKGQKNKTYKYVIMLRAQLDKNVNIRYNIGTT